jgi:hypothetical protein
MKEMEERMEMAGLVNRSKSVDVAAAVLTLLLRRRRPCTRDIDKNKCCSIRKVQNRRDDSDT